jgi:hypothetical protein
VSSALVYCKRASADETAHFTNFPWHIRSPVSGQGDHVGDLGSKGTKECRQTDGHRYGRSFLRLGRLF